MFIIISISSFYLNIELILVVNYLKVNLKKILIFCSLATQPILLGTYLVTMEFQAIIRNNLTHQ